MGIDATLPVSKDFPKKANVPKEVWEGIHLEDYV